MLLSKLSNLSEPQFPQGNETVMGFPSGPVVKNLPYNAGATGDTGSIPGSERCLKEEMATHTSILARIIPWTGEPGTLQSMGSQRVRHN